MTLPLLKTIIIKTVSPYRLGWGLSIMIVIFIKTLTGQRPRVGTPLAPTAELDVNTQGLSRHVRVDRVDPHRQLPKRLCGLGNKRAMQDSGSSIQSRCRGAVSRRDALKYAASAPVLLSLPTVPLAGAPRAGATSALAGRMVFLDPGHNGANDASISEQVTNGRGGTKECQTTGTSTDAAYPLGRCHVT